MDPSPQPGATDLPVSTPAEVADVDVVIVSYHSRDLVVRALTSLPDAAPSLSLSLTVVDNGSGDGILDLLGRSFPHVAAIDMGRNAGFAVANNHGLSLGSARYALVLNPDTAMRPNSLRELVSFADAHPAAAVVAPQLLNPDGSAQQTARRFPTPAAALFGRRSPLSRWFPGNRWTKAFLLEAAHSGKAAYPVDWVSGAAMLVRREAINAVGAFDEGYFLFWEDADWCRRLKLAGWDVWCLPMAEVIHDEGGTRGRTWTAQTIRHFHRGAYRYWMKHHAPQAWNPVRWAAAAGLGARASVLIVYYGIRRRLARSR